MKKILFILLFMVLAGVKSPLFAQTEKELLLRLLDKQDKMSEQMAVMDKRLTEQITTVEKKIAIVEAKLDTKTEGLQKQLDIIVYFLVSVFGIIATIIVVIMWDRRAALKPIEAKFDSETEKLKVEINILKEKEVKSRLRDEIIFREMAKIDNRFADIFRNAGIL